MPTRTPTRPSRARRPPAPRSWAWRYRRLLFLLGVLAATSVAGAAWVAAQVPLPPDSSQAQTTTLYDANGARLAVLHGTEDRVPVKLDAVPKVVQQAVVAAEDRKFFEHRGLDPMSIFRAAWTDLRHERAVEGGSTITQQYVKNFWKMSDRTLSRKVKEAVLAVKVERKYDKQAILERYLNTVYFGRGAYGVQAAARAYFARDVGQLHLQEASYLAGLIRSPVMADVARSPATARARRSEVLASMLRDRTITPEQSSAVENVPLESYVVRPSRAEATVAKGDKGTQYFVEYVRRLLVKQFGEDMVLHRGMQVQTTLDLRLQEQAYDAVYGTLDNARDPAGGLVALDPEGHIVAMVGGRDWKAPQGQVNLALGPCDAADRSCVEGGGSGRQGGSAFKPFLLAETVREGYTVESSFTGPPKVVIPKADEGRDWEVTNFEDESFGRINLVDATAESVNTVYAQLVMAVGPDKVVQMANDLGIKHSKLSAVPSITLGTQEVSPLDMADAYLTFANEGVQVDPRAVRRVTLGGTELVGDHAKHNRVLDRSQANVVNFVLRQVVERGTGTGAKLSGGRPTWGKTGTSENYGDAWFVGYNPKLTAAVWMGYPEGQARPLLDVHGVAKVNGGSLPATIFSKFMSGAVKGDPGAFPVPSSFPGRVLGSRVPFVEGGSPTSVPTTLTTATTRKAPTVVNIPLPSTAVPRETATTVHVPTTTRGIINLGNRPPPPPTTTRTPSPQPRPPPTRRQRT